MELAESSLPIIANVYKVDQFNINNKNIPRKLVNATILPKNIPKAIPLLDQSISFKPSPLVDDKFSITTRAAIIIFAILICI